MATGLIIILVSIRITKLPHERITVIPNALNYPYKKLGASEAITALTELGIGPQTPFLLHIGCNQWYKNREGVIRIFRRLINTPKFRFYRLVMAGSPLPFKLKKLIGRLNIETQVIEVIDVTSESLNALYSMAQALLFPSFYESFGWPILEAQASGCPVITSNRPPMNQVGDTAAIYIDPDDEQAAASIIVQRLLKDRDVLSHMGLKNVSRFSKITMTENYIAAYRAARRQTF